METPTAFKKYSSGHLQNEESIKAKDMATSYYNFSLAICQHPDARYLIVQETPKHQLLWWLPGGRYIKEISNLFILIDHFIANINF